MNETWYSPLSMRMSEGQVIQVEAAAPHSSPWFQGHFPGEPILPGIAQIGLVWEAIRHFAGDESGINIKEVRRLRFRRIIRPGEMMAIEIVPETGTAGRYNFKISVSGELACNGLIVTGQEK